MDGGIIHDGAHYRVLYRRVSDDPFTVVYFESLQDPPRLDTPPSAQDFFLRRGVNFIGVKPAQNDWYQHDEINAALAAIRAATPGARLAGYGGSMGAYAAVNFANDLGLVSLLAICPQYSLQPAKVPFERRWLAEAAAIDFRNDRINAPPRLRRGFIMFDPQTEDRLHAERILAHHDLTPLPIWFTGHEQLRFLTQAGISGDVILGLLRGEMDRAEVVRRVRAARRKSNIVWHGVAKLRLRRGEIAAAARAMDRAEEAPLPDPFDAAVTRGKILRRVGRKQEAEALVAAFLDNPATAPQARWRLDHWAEADRDWAARHPPASWWRRLLERRA